MAKHTSEVRGDLLRWARVQQDLTMRWIQDNGGPSMGYQSEVEKGKKKEVTTGMLLTWVDLLQVTEAFACGQVPKYQENCEFFRGLAQELGERLRSVLPEKWLSFTAQERVRRTLKLVARHSGTLPRVVLAYALDIPLRTLDDMMAGQHPVMREQMEALAMITNLPETFFRSGALESEDDQGWLEQYLPALRLAHRAGVTPSELEELIKARLGSLRGTG